MAIRQKTKDKEIVIATARTGGQAQEVMLSDTRMTAVTVERGATARVVIKGMGNLRMDVHEGADVRVVSIVGPGHVSREVKVGRNSTLNWSDICYGGDALVVRTSMTLFEEAARAVHNCVYIGGTASHKDFQTTIRHTASHTVSRMHVRGVLGGSARAAYKGVTVIDANTVGCDADQRHKTLLLDDTAEVTNDPVLEVHAENVTCGHGASITRVDAEKIFFLKTRGIKERDANNMIVHGFVRALVEDLSDRDAAALHAYTDKLV